ncbi:MAG TPA: hypothetical protein V6C88_14805 [Chroococcidiopsis sp.]
MVNPMLPLGSLHLSGLPSLEHAMIPSADDENAIAIAISLLKLKNPRIIQKLKDLLTFIPNPNRVKNILEIAVIRLVHSCPQSALWLFENPEILEPDVQVRKIIAQELTRTVRSWGDGLETIQFTADYHLDLSDAAHDSLLSYQPKSTDISVLTLLYALHKV